MIEPAMYVNCVCDFFVIRDANIRRSHLGGFIETHRQPQAIDAKGGAV